MTDTKLTGTLKLTMSVDEWREMRDVVGETEPTKAMVEIWKWTTDVLVMNGFEVSDGD